MQPVCATCIAGRELGSSTEAVGLHHAPCSHLYCHAQEAAERAAFVQAARAARAAADAKPAPEGWYEGPHGPRVRALEALALEQAKDGATRSLALDTLLVSPMPPVMLVPGCVGGYSLPSTPLTDFTYAGFRVSKEWKHLSVQAMGRSLSLGSATLVPFAYLNRKAHLNGMNDQHLSVQALGRSLSSGSAVEALAALGVWSAHEHLSLRRMGLTAVFSAELEVCTL